MLACDLCGQALAPEAAGRRHRRRAHLGRQPRCPLCGAAAAPGCDELRRHVEAAHPQPGPPGSRRRRSPPDLAEGLPECPFCGEAAGRELEAHVRARHGLLLGAPGAGERRRGVGGGCRRGWAPRRLGLAVLAWAGSGEPGAGGECTASGPQPERLLGCVFMQAGAAGGEGGTVAEGGGEESLGEGRVSEGRGGVTGKICSRAGLQTPRQTNPQCFACPKYTVRINESKSQSFCVIGMRFLPT